MPEATFRLMDSSKKVKKVIFLEYLSTQTVNQDKIVRYEGHAISPTNDWFSGKFKLITNQTVHSLPLYLPSFPVNNLRECHDLSNAVARLQNETNILSAAAASRRLFKNP